MNLDRLEPPDWPTLDQQLGALRQGLGRAVPWATDGRLDDGPLLTACLTNLQYDAQLVEPRGNWLWGLVEAVGAVARFRDPILDALTGSRDTWTTNQLCELARHYAQAGDEAFRHRLREIVRDKPVEESPWLGEEELIQVEGEAGFLFVVQVRGELLDGPERDWEDFTSVRTATELFGAARTTQLLDEATDEASTRFRLAWQRQEASESPRGEPESGGQSRANSTPAEIIQTAETTDYAYRLHGWGRQATPDQLREIADRLWKTPEPRVLANLLRVFSTRALPEFDPRLSDLCRHDDPATRRAAFIALGENNHPLVRDFAIKQVASSLDRGPMVGLLDHNYEPGDEALLLEAFHPPDDLDDRHSLLMTVLDFLKTNPTADAAGLGLLVYALTPCEICRAGALKILLDQSVAPGWLRDEARRDASERCRTLVAAADKEPAD